MTSAAPEHRIQRGWPWRNTTTPVSPVDQSISRELPVGHDSELTVGFSADFIRNSIVSDGGLMGPLTYSLCHSKFGIAMWITGLCAFPPLIELTGISLQEPGVVLQKEFKAPVDKTYLIYLRFVFPSTDDRLKDELVGDGRSSKYCYNNIQYEDIPMNERRGLGIPIDLKVVVRTQPQGDVVTEQIFHTLCKTFHSTDDKGRDVGRIDLKEGAYNIEVYNPQAQPAFKDIKVEISLVSGDGK